MSITIKFKTFIEPYSTKNILLTKTASSYFNENLIFFLKFVTKVVKCRITNIQHQTVATEVKSVLGISNLKA